MKKIFGDYIDPMVANKEFLQICFSTRSDSLRQRWRNNGLSADFMADYLAFFFTGDDHASRERQAEIKDAVSYVANELLENAMKFNFEPAGRPVSIEMQLGRDCVTFYVANSIDPLACEGFKDFISTLLNADPDELYLRRLMENEAADDAQRSGLGFLTMLNHYQARLAWKFQELDPPAGHIVVTTMVRLPV